MSYIGTLGLDTFDDELEDTSNTLVNRIVYDINNTSNYVLTTSNILATRIYDTSNVLATRINDTSNVLATRINDTSNVLATRIKDLEGTEGSPGDISLGIPPIPSSGGFATAASIAALTAASYLGGVSVISMIVSLEIEVDSNKTEADKVGGWSSNYSDKVGVWGSNYTDLVTTYTSNYADKVGIWGSNYTDLVGIYGSNYADKVGIWGSNYTDLVTTYTSNYADKVGIWGSNYTDLVGIYGSNYTDKVGVWGSNYTDLVGIYGSNYADKVGVWGSNYTDLQVKYTSNYVERLTSGLGTATNYWTKDATTNIYLNQTGNVGIGTTPTTKLHVYEDTTNETKLIIQNNTNVVGGARPTEISVTDATSTPIGTADRMLVFPYTGSVDTKDYSFTPTQNLICDILVVVEVEGLEVVVVVVLYCLELILN
jgi:hypothetical protein